MGRESPEHHAVHRTEAGAGEHGDQRLGDHGHVQQHPVALRHIELPQHARAQSHRIPQLPVTEMGLGARHRGVINQRRAFAVAGGDMHIQRQIGGVEYPVGKPARHPQGIGGKSGPGLGKPVQTPGLFEPIGFRIRCADRDVLAVVHGQPPSW